MKRTLIIAVLLLPLFLASVTTLKAQEKANITKPKVILFDVNETLLDLKGLQASVGKALGGRGDLLPLWFSTMLGKKRCQVPFLGNRQFAYWLAWKIWYAFSIGRRHF